MSENLLSKFNLDGTEITVVDTKARKDASDAATAASTAITNADIAKQIAIKKALITYDSDTNTMKITQGVDNL